MQLGADGLAVLPAALRGEPEISMTGRIRAAESVGGGAESMGTGADSVGRGAILLLATERFGDRRTETGTVL